MIESKSRNYDMIEVLCNKRGITVNRMCLDIGIRNSLLADLKSGRTKYLSSETVVKIANYMNVSADVLLGIRGEGKDAKTVNVTVRTDGMDEALGKARELRDTLERAYEIIRILGGANER